MEVGKYTYGTQHIRTKWDQYGKLKIGNFCSIADNILIFLGGNHSTEWITTFPFGTINKDIFNKKIPQQDRKNFKRCLDVTIGNDFWIAGGVTIMAGVTIGDGAVIARNSHVVKNVEPYSVVGGNPAKLIYYRFNEETIKKLLELKWWDFDDKIINEISPYLCSSDYNKLFEFCEKMGYKK